MTLPFTIGEGNLANIAESDEAAFRQNVLTNTRNAAIRQINTMVNLIDDISTTMVVNSVSGEENKVSTPLGAEMIVSKKSGDKCTGDDIDGDGVPDLPLRYEFPNANTDSMNVVQFPLGFCPGRPETNFMVTVGSADPKDKCPGSWGIVVKEWKIFMASYPPTAKNLNPTTKQLDVDVYDDKGNLVKIEGMPSWAPIELTIMRQKDKSPKEVTFNKNQTYRVYPVPKLKQLEKRMRSPIIYHSFTVDKPMASLTVQLRMDEYFHRDNTTMAFMLRYKKLPTLQSCEAVKLVGSMDEMDGKYLSEFFAAEFVANRTGAWFLGMIAFDSSIPAAIIDGENCSVNQIDAGMLNSKTFATAHYTTRIYASGCYFFNKTTDMWEASGISVANSTKIVTSCFTNHLSQYGSGFIQEVNTIDFEFNFADASFEDNMTIFMCLIITFAIYFICMIYAVVKDNRDIKRLAVPFLRDNHAEDMYMYEVIVETGPLAQHATTSQIYFVLTGEEEDTGVRCFTDPSRKLFTTGGIDSFLLTTQVPLGELKMLRLWNDNSGLRDMGAWYVLGATVKDVQTGVMDKFIFDEWVACDRDNYQDDVVAPAVPNDLVDNAYYLLKAGGNRRLADDHLWWSIFSRPIRSRFTRKERVTVCMAMMYLFFLFNAMMYGGLPDRISVPILTASFLKFDFFDIGQGLYVNLMVLPPIVLVAVLFRKSMPAKKRSNRIDNGIQQAVDEGIFSPTREPHQRDISHEEKKRNKSWPSIGFIISWILCFVYILAGAGFVMLYALSFGNDKTYQWMVALIVTFLASVFIYQPIKILLITFVVTACCKRANFDDDHQETDEVMPAIYWDEEAEAEAREAFNSPISHLSLQFSVAI